MAALHPLQAEGINAAVSAIENKSDQQPASGVKSPPKEAPQEPQQQQACQKEELVHRNEENVTPCGSETGSVQI
jgi:hypothetical protein